MTWRRMPWPEKAKAPYLAADISSNNAGFNAAQYASAGHLLIIIKATQGTSYTSPDWATWVRDAHNHKLAVAHYHFCDGSDALKEADHFWTTIRSQYRHGRDRLVIDLEQPTLEQLGARAPSYLATLDKELHRLAGEWAIGYTFRSALAATLKIGSGKWLVAAWGNQWPAGIRRRLPDGTLWGWQFTNGQIGAPGPRGAAGIGTCDLSVLSPAIVAMLN